MEDGDQWRIVRPDETEIREAAQENYLSGDITSTIVDWGVNFTVTVYKPPWMRFYQRD